MKNATGVCSIRDAYEIPQEGCVGLRVRGRSASLGTRFGEKFIKQII